MPNLIRRFRAGLVLGGVVAAFWAAFFILRMLLIGTLQGHPDRILMYWLPRMLPTTLGVSAILGGIFAGSLYLWRPSDDRVGLSGGRAALVGACTTGVGFLAMQAIFFGGWSDVSTLALLLATGGLAAVGAIAGLGLQRVAYRRSLAPGSTIDHTLAP